METYFAGKTVIDVGCGFDPVVPWAFPFDHAHGDANLLATYFPPATFDVVHSSHCLEHMRDPGEALAQWWQVLKPGGVMITVVPDEELYEQGYWPSIFNDDHKWAFTLDEGRPTWPGHLAHLPTIHLALPGAELVDVQKHDRAYRRDLLENVRGKTNPENFRRYRRFISWVMKYKLDKFGLTRLGWPWVTRHGVPVDQTLGPAMAQLQIIVRKAGGPPA